MKFGQIKIDNARGTILAHSVIAGGRQLRKGRILNESQIDLLKHEGLKLVTVAKLEEGEIHEDQAVEHFARQLTGNGITARPATRGQVKLSAEYSGLVMVNVQTVHAINLVDQSLTMATKSHCHPVAAGDIVALIKLIPYGISTQCLTEISEVLTKYPTPPLAIRRFSATKIGVIQTFTTATKSSVMDKTTATLEWRLIPSASQIIAETRIGHDTKEIAAAITRQIASGSEIIILFGANAICDINDVIPRAISELDGEIIRFGMPVDPGNLLLLGRLAKTMIIGAPGCARTLQPNGFDLILNRLLARIPISGEDITRFGVGGLL